MPLGDVALVGAQGHLRVDRRRAAHAASGEKRDDVAVGERRQAQRPPDVVVRVSLPAHEVRGGAVGAGLEQQDIAATLGELAGDDAATGARSHHDDVEPVLHAPASGA